MTATSECTRNTGLFKAVQFLSADLLRDAVIPADRLREDAWESTAQVIANRWKAECDPALAKYYRLFHGEALRIYSDGEEFERWCLVTLTDAWKAEVGDYVTWDAFPEPRGSHAVQLPRMVTDASYDYLTFVIERIRWSGGELKCWRRVA